MPLTSTPLCAQEQDHPPEWARAGLRFHALSHFLQHRFGHRVWKISIDAGLSCPNLDGTLAHQGCIFCDSRSFSPSRRLGRASQSVSAQIADGASRLKRRYGNSANRFLAYFQPGTNTHGPIERLCRLWRESVSPPEIEGLIVGTRPDCVSDDILQSLKESAGGKWASIEFGLQSIHQTSLDWLERRHNFRCFEDAVVRSHAHDLHVGVHLMLGLPGETRDQIMETAREMVRLKVNSVKLHNLYVVRDTPLVEQWNQGDLSLPTRDEYVQLVADFLEILPPTCVIDRVVGDAPPAYLVAPEWCRRKAEIRNLVEKELERRGTRQGSKCVPAH